jgi:flagellar biosynthetic protein FlhB
MVLLAGAAGLISMAGGMGRGMREMMTSGLTLDRRDVFDPTALTRIFSDTLIDGFNLIIPFMVLLLVAVFLSPIMIGGFSFSMKAVAPKFSKLNPIKGMKKLFSMHGLVELLKAMAKVILIGGAAAILVWSYFPDLMSLGGYSLNVALARADEILGWSLLVMSAMMIFVVAVDVPFQLYQHFKQLKMTKQEVKDERKNTEGDPQVKGHIRQLQQEMAMARMMEEVPKADVVVTNPTHYAVALKYDDKRMGAPRVVAKGSNLIAARIREIATENNVPLFSAPPLARAIYFSTEINDEIPSGLYLAVAQVLAYIFQLKAAVENGFEKPVEPEDLPVPDEFLKKDPPGE